ncbi:hypothetical protein [Streptomyces sp.]|uniref:hypothetical protein n=1 Tax=Streptomyces sp. TaxID=1931 RepID=UPI002F95719C
MTEQLERLNEVLSARRLELGMKTWRDLSLAAGISYETLRALRVGDGRPGEATIHGLNRALRYQDGAGVEALLNGRDPKPVDASRQPPERDADTRLEEILADPEIRAAFARRIARMFDTPPSPPSNEEEGRSERSDSA